MSIELESSACDSNISAALTASGIKASYCLLLFMSSLIVLVECTSCLREIKGFELLLAFRSVSYTHLTLPTIYSV